MAAEMRQARALSAIRSLRAEDAPAVADILRQAPEAVFWPEASVREVLQWPGVLAIAGETSGQLTGFLIARQAGDEAEILNLAVARAERRRGEGGALLCAAVESFRSRGVSRVFLEVRELNGPAIAFYEKYGFSKTSRRERYYRDHSEAALVMACKLPPIEPRKS
jgi:[ribosomal protein S18]-alanine N-acetyltransferase